MIFEKQSQLKEFLYDAGLSNLFLPFTVLMCLMSCSDHKQAEHDKLVKLYHDGLKEVYDRNNTFNPEAELGYYDSTLTKEANTPQKKMMAELLQGFTHIKLGEETKAVEILKPLYERAKLMREPAFEKEVGKNLALAFLRLGEKNNCITGHMAGSCIFPILGSAVYTDQGPTREGIKLYEEMLQKDPSEMESRWLLNIAYMTLGEYPSRVPARFLIGGLDEDTSSTKVRPFEDMAAGLGLNNERNMAGGSIVDDFNNDGFLDIVTSAWGLGESMHFYKNNGDNTFTDETHSSGLDSIRGGLNIIQADYNNDGYTDIFVLRGAWAGEYGKQPNTLLKNMGNGKFTDVTVESGLLSFHPTQTATWADFNNDGWLDIFIGNETPLSDHPHPAELYINNQDGSFSNVGDQARCAGLGYIKGVTSGDYDRDGWPDIFISGLNGGKILLRNTGVRSRIPVFENATGSAGFDKEITNTFPTWFWDYNNDGWPDIFVCGYLFEGSLAKIAAEEALNKPLDSVSRMYLYRNNHNGTFTNVSKVVGLDRPVFAMGSNFGDIDNDGWPDMYLGTGNPDYRSLVPNRMFKNIEGKKFADVTKSARVGNLQKGHGVSFADIDNDGDQDIFMEVGGAYKGDAFFNSLDINPGQNDNNWIVVKLEGVQTNRSAIGAHVIVSFTENGLKRSVYQDINSGGSFGASPLQKEIGIGKATVIDELTINWPTSGKVQVFKNVQPGQFIHIREGDHVFKKENFKVLDFSTQHAVMNMPSAMPGSKH